MRVSTQQIFQAGLSGMLQQQSTLNQLSQQLSMGNALTNPADNPTAYSQSLNLGARIANLQSYQQSNQYAQQNLQLSSSSLQSVSTLMNQVQQLAVQMNNATVNSSDLQNAITTMQGNLQQLVQLANTQNGNGQYIYGGSTTDQQPFALQGNNTVLYQGDSSQQSLQIGPSLNLPVSQAGNQVFMNIPGGNGTFSVTADSGNYGAGSGTVTLGPGAVIDQSAARNAFVAQGAEYQVSISANASGALSYTVSSGTASGSGGLTASGVVSSGAYKPGQSINIPGPGGSPMASVQAQGQPADGQTQSFTLAASKPQSLFQTFSDLIQAFQAGSGSPGANAKRAQGISNVLQNLSQAQTQILGVQAQIGSNLQEAQSVSSLNSSLTTQFQTTQSSLSDISYPQVITQFQESSTALQAAQKAFVQVQGLSLFQYI